MRFVLSLGAALLQAGQLAVVKGRARAIPPLVIVAWTQTVAFTAWVVFFAVSSQSVGAPRTAWTAIAVSALLVMGMSGLLARAAARGDISIVGPILALSPIFTVLPDALGAAILPGSLAAVDRWGALAIGSPAISSARMGRPRSWLVASRSSPYRGAWVTARFPATS
jgi:drug/metabolite transporter (DMT)-like permease